MNNNMFLQQVPQEHYHTLSNHHTQKRNSFLEESQKQQRLSTCGSGSTIDEEFQEQCQNPQMLQEFKNPQFVTPYRSEIQQYMLQEEIKYMPTFNYMSIVQKDITPKMRTILIDWIEEVHMKFKLSQNSLHLAINLIDRYLSLIPIKRNKLQLVGIASLFISAKYEEIYPPNIKDFVYVCDRAYSKEEILRMEGHILNAIQFKLNYISPLRFLELKIIENSQIEANTIFRTYKFQLASYLLEIMFHTYDYIKYLPSKLADISLYLTNHMLGIQEDLGLEEYQYDLVRQLGQLFWSNQTNSVYPAVKRKYGKEDCLQVSTIQFSMF